jgi:hypothetical protein
MACVNPALAPPERISYADVSLFLWAKPMLDFFLMFTNPAMIAILAFIAAIIVLNVIEFGRVD